MYVAERDDEHIVLYTWEGFGKQRKKLLAICEWLRTAWPSTNRVRVSLFCRDGYLECGMFGEEVDEDLCVIPGTIIQST
jgi:hypothetical protein